MQRYFVSNPIEETIELSREEKAYDHLVKALRAQVGTKAEFFDNQGRLVLGQVNQIDKKSVFIDVIHDIEQSSSVELPIDVTLVVSPIKKDRNEWLVEKATELGVHRILLVPMQRTVVNWTEKQQEKQMQRFRDKAIGAAEQSHRLHVPEIRFATFDEILKLDKDHGVVAWEESAKQGEKSNLIAVADMAKPGQTFVALFGPEGGLTEEEIQKLSQAQYEPAGLGPRILRAETAPLYLLSALSVSWELKN